MGNMHLVTGFAGQEHITAIDQGAFNAALIGTGQFVLDKGKALEAQIISNNQIRILDGELMMHGRFVRLNPDTYVDLTIENGVQGKKRNDLIVARYTKQPVTGIESVDLVVIKGTSVDSNPVDPSHTEGDITNGAATQHDFPLWRIPLDGLNVGSPVALFGDPFMDSMRTLPEIRRQVNEIHGEVDKQLSEHDKQIDEKIAGIESYTKKETLSDSTKAMFGKGATALPNDIFAFLGKYNEHWWSVLFGVAKGYYEPALGPATGCQLGATEDMYGMGGNFVKGYSKELDVSADGKVDLKNAQSIGYSNVPKSFADCQTFANAIISKAPCYIKVEDIVGQVTIHYIPAGATYTSQPWYDPQTDGTLVAYDSEDYGDGIIYSLSINGASYATVPASTVTGATYVEGDPGTTIFKHSADRNAYPDSGTVNGETYTYLGIPFEKLPVVGRVETGSYTGTGTYGASNKNSLTFAFNPKLVLILCGAYVGIMFSGSATGVVLRGSSTPLINLSWGDQSVSWYYSSGNSAEYQLNTLNTKYNYIAIG